jgi:phosphatidylglycerol:prolipoprotein diacylglycerol transferase
MLPKLFSLDGFFLPTYGLLMAVAFLVGLWMASRLARQAGISSERTTNLGVYVALAGLLGAKLLMLVVHSGYYLRQPGEIFSLATLQAGGVYYGGLAAALLIGYLYMRARGLAVRETLDAFAPAIALGYVFGRLGCFAAGCCWGLECHRPWAVTFTDPEANRLVGVPLNVPLHPTQLYLAAASLVIFAILYRQFQRPHRAGAVMGLYLVLYAIARFLIDFFRDYDAPAPFGGPLELTQWIAIGLFGLGAWLLSNRSPALKPSV